MNTITITKELIKKYRLPVKAIGNWGIEDVGEEFAILRRLREDGMFASDYPKNNYKLYREVFDEISLNDEKLLTAKASNGQTVVVARMHTENISEPQVGKPTNETVKMDEPPPKWQFMNTDPQTGLTLEYRAWGDADSDTSKEIIECNYGFGVGESAALKRIVSA